jgi:hypothetical protein
MTDVSKANTKISWSLRSLVAIGLGVGAEFIAESLKFMAGAALRTLNELILLYSFNPIDEVWSFVKDMVLIVVIVGGLIWASVFVGKAIGNILNHKGETIVLIISILITGLILEEIDQKKYQEEWDRKHSAERIRPVKRPSTPAIVPTK